MHNPSLKAVAVMTLGFSTIAHAATEQDAIEACARIAAERIEQHQGVMPKVSFGGLAGERNYSLHGVTLYHLDAVDPATDKVVLRLDCRVNRHAKVLSVRTLSMDANSAAAIRRNRDLESPVSL